MTLAGTKASGFVKFLVNSFGSSKEMSEYQATAALHIPAEEDEEEAEVALPTSAKDAIEMPLLSCRFQANLAN